MSRGAARLLTPLLLALFSYAQAAQDAPQASPAEIVLQQRFQALLTVQPLHLPLKLVQVRPQSVPFSLTWGQVQVTPYGLELSEGVQFFSLAHELAHWNLCHLHYAIGIGNKLQSIGVKRAPAQYLEAKRSFELAADRVALQMLDALGRDGLGDALATFAALSYLDSPSPAYPSEQQRIDALLRDTAEARRHRPASGPIPPASGPLPLPEGVESFCSFSVPDDRYPRP